MRLALNTFVYEVGNVPIEQALQSACTFGFKFIEYAAYHSGDPTVMAEARRNDVVRIFEDNGLGCSQMLLANTQHIASPGSAKRKETLDYMK